MEAYEALARAYDQLITPQEREQWLRDVPQRLAEAGVTPPMRVLDLACGTGQLALCLAQAGYRVMGVDLSPQMLDQAAKNAQRQGVFLPRVQQDMRRLDLHHEVEAVLCVCDGLNYMTTPEDLRQALGSVCRVLRPGGLFLFDVSTREKLQAMDGEFYGEEEENVAYLWENRFDQASQCLTMDITFFFQVDAARDLFRRQRELHVQRGHSREELEAALTAAGFAVQTVEEAFTRHSPAPGCQRIQITARKR